MGIIQMSISAAILILAVILIRQLAIHKLPKKLFIILWGVVLFRLLIPFSITLPAPVYQSISTVVGGAAGSPIEVGNAPSFPGVGLSPSTPPNMGILETINTVIPDMSESTLSFPVASVWIVGIAAIALFFIVTHFRSRMEYKASLPVDNFYINKWIKEQKMIRHIQVRQSDRIAAPLTYGIWKPVILFPKTTDWQDIANLRYVLTHEITHIRRFDILTKWLLAAALCVHWFNPLVWAMYVLANRDIELSCDEAVVKTFGESKKSAYAMALIGLEENRGMFSPLCTNFSKNSIEERIVAIMKMKKKSILGLILAVVMVSALTVGTLAVFANTNTNGQNGTPEAGRWENTSSTPSAEFRTQLDVGAGETNTELGFTTRPLTEEEIAERQRLAEGMPDAEPIPTIYLGDYENAIMIPQGTSEVERRELMERNPDSVFRVHIDDINIAGEFELNLLAVRRSDEHLYTTEQWANILERIEQGLTVWMDED